MKDEVKYSVSFWGRDSEELYEKFPRYYEVDDYLSGDPFVYLFNTKEEYKETLRQMKNIRKENDWSVVISEHESIIAHYQVIARMTLVYNGKKYPYEENFGYGYDPDAAHFMFFEGNYSCDCNLYDFLYRKYGEEEFGKYEDKDCGDSILIEDFEIVLKPFGGWEED